MNPNITQVICVNLAISYIIHEFSIIFLANSPFFPWFSQGFPMVFPWFSHGFPMVFPWFPLCHAPKISTELRGCWARRLHDSASPPGERWRKDLQGWLGEEIYLSYISLYISMLAIYIYILQVCYIYIILAI